MRIGIDCRLAGVQHAGLGRYTQSLVSQLVLSYPTDEWVLFLADQKQLNLFPKQASFKSIVAPYRHYSLAEQVHMPKVFYQANLDLVHVPHFNAPVFYQKPFVITIHDLLWHQYKGSAVTTLHPLVYWPKYLMYRAVVQASVSRAKKIILPTHTVAKTLLDYYKINQKKLVISYEGAEPNTQSEPVKSVAGPYLLYVGSLYPHKNVNVILRALKYLPYKLLVVSSRNIFFTQFEKEVASLGLRSKVQVLHHVSDNQLRYLYQHAIALVQPSFSEGFGLTILEAIQAGGQVVCSDIPVFKELYQQAVIFFDPHSSGSLIEVITSLNKTEEKRRDCAKNLVKKYSWQKTAEITYKAYEEALR